MKETHVSKTHQ